MGKKKTVGLVVVAVLGFILLISGIVLLFERQAIITHTIEEKVRLKNGTAAFDNWKSPPATVYMQFWVFNVTNPWQVIDRGDKPNVTQRGPYTYREVRTKKEMAFLANSSRISYRESKAYVFVPEMSVGLSNESFTTVNLPVLTVAALLEKKKIPGLALSIIASFLSAEEERLFEEHTVHEFLWGYKEKVLEKINHYTEKYLGYNFTTTVGLFTGPTKNGSDDGVYEVYTGMDQLERLNEYVTWNNDTSLHFWNSSYCNMLNGTDGSMWHPFIKTTERLYIFSSDICRSIYVDYNLTNSVQGIKTYHFVPPPTVFMDHVKNPGNAGFCVPKCLESGVLDVSSCKSAPIIVSQPHFYQGSPNYINAIHGMEPRSEYATFMDIEPNTGASLKVAKKLQLNAKITNLKAFKDTRGFNMTIFPMLWLNESAELDPNTADELKSALEPIEILEIASYVAIALGALIILCVLIYVIVSFVRKRKDTYGVLVEEDVPRGDI